MIDEIAIYNQDVMAGRPATKAAPLFGQRLSALRKARGLTQRELAEALGTTREMVDYFTNLFDDTVMEEELPEHRRMGFELARAYSGQDSRNLQKGSSRQEAGQTGFSGLTDFFVILKSCLSIHCFDSIKF